MEFIHIPASRFLMEAVNILGHDCGQFSCRFQLGQLPVRGIRLNLRDEHFILVEAVEFVRIPHEKGVADDRFRRIPVLLVI